MFGRIFHRGKDENSGSKGPPGHRPSQVGGGSGGGGEEHAAPVGGGFFNLPPTGGQSQYGPPSSSVNSFSSTNASGNGAPGYHHGRPSGAGNPTYGAQHPPASGPTYGAPSGYGQPPQPLPTYNQPQVPSYGGNSVAGNSVGGGPPTGGGMDMFGGMSIKSSAPSAPSGYGGAVPPAPVGGSGSGSLFSGLELGTAASAEEPDRRKSGPFARNSSSSYNYLDNVTADAQRSTSGSTQRVPGGGSSSVGKVKKKKTKSFRPGFGRQLSDESIAALQRGELKEDELMAQPPSQSQSQSTTVASVKETTPPRIGTGIATSATDLAHLLPPVRSGSVLAGLTVHGGNSSSSGGVLAGLTVHSTLTAASISPCKSSDPSSTNGILAGLNVRSSGDATTSVILPTSLTIEPEKPKSPPTPEERLLNTLRDFHASASTFRTNTLHQTDQENRILERKIHLSKQLTQYEMDVQAIETQQQNACEEEDFEKADALNTTINSIRHCITLTESDVRKVDQELTAFFKGKEKAFLNQLRSTRGTLKELEKFREDQEIERTALREELKKYEMEETEQLKQEGDRIETELHHVTLNLNHLTSEKQEIETSIEEQCSHEITSRNELVIQRTQVEVEIQELERQLQLKMEQMSGIQASIDKAESEIDIVRNRYARQLKRIADREEGILRTKAEVEEDAQQLKEEKKVFTETIQQYEEQIVAFGKRMKSVKMEMRAAKLLANVLEVQELRREQGNVRKKQQTAELTSLSDAAVIAEQSFVMLQKQHDELEKSMLLHKNAIASAESMIPTLEQEKKTAATQRNFKEAARISKDIKALEKDQAIAEEMVEVVEMELQDLKERIGKREVEYKEKKQEWKEVEKRLELATLQELWKEAKSVRKSLRQIERIKSDGIAAADGIDFKTSALLLVQAEYDACMVQIEALEERYDVTDYTQDEEEEEEEEEGEEDAGVNDDEVERMADLAVMKSTSMSAIDDSNGVEGGYMDLLSEGGVGTLEDIAVKLKELETMIEKATENEDYELAVKLDEKIEMLRRRHQSIQALMSHGSVHEDEDEENEEEEDEKEDKDDEHLQPHSPVSKAIHHRSQEELETDLRLVRARITMMEADIERAIENEDYDTAAELDESLEGLRQELATIEELLAKASSHANEVQTEEEAVREMPPLPMPSASVSMFSGLTVSAPSNDKSNAVESPSSPPASSPRKSSDLKSSSPRKSRDFKLSISASEDSSPTPPSSLPSMFSGLMVSSSVEEDESSVPIPSSPPSMFKGLLVSSSPADEMPPLPTPLSPTTKSSGLTVSSKPDEMPPSPTPSSPTRTSSGLKIDSTPINEMQLSPVKSPVSIFSGLMVSASTSDSAVISSVQVDEQPKSPTAQPLSSPRRTSVGSGPNSPRRKSSGGMFGGLQISGGSLPTSPRSPMGGFIEETVETHTLASPREVPLVVDADAAPGSPIGVSSPHSSVNGDMTTPNSPRKASSSPLAGEIPMFGGLQVNSIEAVHEIEESASTSSIVEPTTMFAGLSLSNNISAAPNSPLPAEEDETD